jgi:hypothetical protein
MQIEHRLEVRMASRKEMSHDSPIRSFHMRRVTAGLHPDDFYPSRSPFCWCPPSATMSATGNSH